MILTTVAPQKTLISLSKYLGPGLGPTGYLHMRRCQGLCSPSLLMLLCSGVAFTGWCKARNWRTLFVQVGLPSKRDFAPSKAWVANLGSMLSFGHVTFQRGALVIDAPT